MGDATSKDGWLTDAVESVPAVGPAITSPIHLAAGNKEEAALAWFKGMTKDGLYFTSSDLYL